MNNRIEISWNEAQYKKELETLQDNVRRLNKGKLLCSDITNDEVKELNFPAVKEWLKKYSPAFPNISAIANLLDKKQEFIDAGIIYGNKANLESEFITIDDEGFYCVNDDNLTKLKEKHTVYLKDDKVKSYKTLDKVVSLINTLPLEDINALQKGFNGKYKLNVNRLNTSWTY
jgi:hypothetical protein